MSAGVPQHGAEAPPEAPPSGQHHGLDRGWVTLHRAYCWQAWLFVLLNNKTVLLIASFLGGGILESVASSYNILVI